MACSFSPRMHNTWTLLPSRRRQTRVKVLSLTPWCCPQVYPSLSWCLGKIVPIVSSLMQMVPRPDVSAGAGIIAGPPLALTRTGPFCSRRNVKLLTESELLPQKQNRGLPSTSPSRGRRVQTDCGDHGAGDSQLARHRGRTGGFLLLQNSTRHHVCHYGAQHRGGWQVRSIFIHSAAARKKAQVHCADQ
jgi:hypothetical protein